MRQEINNYSPLPGQKTPRTRRREGRKENGTQRKIKYRVKAKEKTDKFSHGYTLIKRLVITLKTLRSLRLCGECPFLQL